MGGGSNPPTKPKKGRYGKFKTNYVGHPIEETTDEENACSMDPDGPQIGL